MRNIFLSGGACILPDTQVLHYIPQGVYVYQKVINLCTYIYPGVFIVTDLHGSPT